MGLKQLLSVGFLGALVMGIAGCKQESPETESTIKEKESANIESIVEQAAPFERLINGHQYKFVGNKVIEMSSDEDNQARYGIISDAHGEIEKTISFAQKFKEMEVDGILCLGDMASNESLRYGRKDLKDDKEEIRNVLEALAQTGLPIFTIVGNHESKPDYEAAIAEVSVKYPNVIDMTKFRIYDGDDVDFVSLPGYQTFKIPGKQFIPDNGYWAKPEFIQSTGKLRKGLDDMVILVTHGCGKTGSPGPATIYDGRDVGNKTTTEMMRENNIPFAVCGHIHEAGGLAATYDGKIVKPNEFVKQFSANFGGLESWKNLDGNTYNGMAGVLTVKNDEAKFEMLYLQ
ncbi:metallophosphoesterase family protein [Candidatus Woesearchaeota archaeon]|nr:metallophosphoesterase family protein [Candidatus Woesearchaeota archaeon]